MSKKKERYQFFEKELAGFLNSDYKKRIGDLRITYNLPDLDFETPEGIVKIINDRYWNLVESHVKPVLSSKNEVGEDKIDLYKILSCIEYTIIGLRPFVAKTNGIDIDYTSENSAVHCEKIFNGLFAFSTALNFLRSWKGKYSEVFEEFDFLSIIDTTEDIPDRKDSMSRLDEHIAIISFSGNSPVWPIFINSTWWRLLCAFAIEKNRK